MKKSILFIIISTILFSIILTGCKEKKNVLRFATWDSEEALEIQKSIVKIFEEQNPGIKVQVEAYGDGYEQKIAAGIGARNAPDVMYMWDYPSYQASLEVLNEYMLDDIEYKELINDFYPGVLNYSTINGNVLGLPVGFTSHVIYYNKKLFDEAGLEYPAPNWTWDDLRETAGRISSLGPDIYGFGFSTIPDPYDFEQYLWTNDSAYLAPDGSTADGYLNHPNTIRTVRFFVDMIKEGSGIALQDSVSTAFRAGNIGMHESGIWPIGRHKESIGAENLGVAVLPGKNEQTPASSVINSSALCMSKDSSKKELAWKFIKFYTSYEAVKMRSEIDLPVLKSVANDLGYLDDPFLKPFYDMLSTAGGHTPSFLLHPEWSKISEEVSTAIERAFVDTINGEPVNVENIFNEAVDNCDQYF